MPQFKTQKANTNLFQYRLKKLFKVLAQYLESYFKWSPGLPIDLPVTTEANNLHQTSIGSKPDMSLLHWSAQVSCQWIS